MCLSSKSFALLCSIYSTVVAGGAAFINPPAYPQYGYNLATSPSYGLGSTVDIKWTIEPQSNVSLALFQLSGATSLYPYENLFNNLDAGVTSFLWTVRTAKDLAFSNNFWMCLFAEGTTHAAACTNFFNITSVDAGIQAPGTTRSDLTAQVSQSSTKTQPTVPITITASDIVPKPITTSEPIAMPTYVISPTSTSTSATTSMSTPMASISTTSPAPSGLSTVSKAGLGVGVSVGALFAAGIGYLAISRWKKWRETPLETNSTTRSRIFGSAGSSTSLFRDSRVRTPKLPVNISGWT